MSDTADDNYKEPHHEDSDNRGEEEEDKENPLPIPGLSSIPLITQELEQLSNEQSSESMNYELDRHLGTIIEETFWERMTQEPE